MNKKKENDSKQTKRHDTTLHDQVLKSRSGLCVLSVLYNPAKGRKMMYGVKHTRKIVLRGED